MAHIAHPTQGLRYCRMKALPNQPYMTQYNMCYVLLLSWLIFLLPIVLQLKLHMLRGAPRQDSLQAAVNNDSKNKSSNKNKHYSNDTTYN